MALFQKVFNETLNCRSYTAPNEKVDNETSEWKGTSNEMAAVYLKVRCRTSPEETEENNNRIRG